MFSSVRWLFKAEGVTLAIQQADWQPLARTMGAGGMRGLQQAKILSYKEARKVITAINTIRCFDAADYGILDLLCLLCMGSNPSAPYCSDLPPIPLPVTICDDLEM